MESLVADISAALPVTEGLSVPPTRKFAKIRRRQRATAPLAVGAMAGRATASDVFDSQMDLLSTATHTMDVNSVDTHRQELRTTPLFSSAVQDLVSVKAQNLRNTLNGVSDEFPQYGLLAADIEVYEEFMKFYRAGKLDEHPGLEDGRIHLNVNAPWSAFICGSQGSGKSHTLSCMLENSLLPSVLGKLPSPLAGIVFHYDPFTSHSSGQICEAAYLCSSGIPVRVLVSPTNFWRMKEAYENLPGLPAGATKPTVVPMLLREKDLDIQKMMSLMAVSEKDGPMPLYMEVVCNILRRMAVESQGAPGFDYTLFKNRLLVEGFTDKQNGPLRLRLNLLESFMDVQPQEGSQASSNQPIFPPTTKGEKARRRWEQDELRKTEEALARWRNKPDIWSFPPGCLTIVDLSCPFIDEGAACVLFNICLSLFLEDRSSASRIIALDEAHKFMTNSPAANIFTETLLSLIRQQRHLATRIVIATQEPTISPKLLNLSSMTFVHRFTSPEWLNALKSHLAGASTIGSGLDRNLEEIFNAVVDLDPGEALLFSPSAMLCVKEVWDENGVVTKKAAKLGMRYLKVRVRQRLTADGGRSILAT